MYECGRVANNELRDAGLRDAQEHVSMIETILDAPDDFDTSDIGVHISAIKEYLNDSQLVSDGVLDSLDIMNLIMELEAAFDIEIDPEDVLSDNFESVDAILNLVEKCKA